MPARMLALLALTGWAQAQQGGGPPPQALPPLMECGTHGGDIEILCGTRSPEDLEATPDGKFLIVSQFVNDRGGTGGAGIVLFDLAKKTFSKMTVKAEPRKDWGDPACPGDTSNLLGGQATGYVVRWTTAAGEVELPGTRIGYPNGVVVSADGRYIYVNAWTACEVHKYDLKDGEGNRGDQAGLHAR